MTPPLVYHDRRSGESRVERVHAAGFLHWLYNTPIGAALEPAFRMPCLSRLFGWVNRRPWSRRRIRRFVERLGIDMADSAKRIEEFRSFSEFFTRELAPGARPVCAEPGSCVAPVDGKVLAYPQLDARAAFRIKRSVFDLVGLLRDRPLAETFAGGSMIVSRLGLADCHHFHFPDSGVPSAPRTIDGCLHAGGPYALGRLVPFFTENHRAVTPFESDHFGPMAIVEVGALTVGSIQQRYRPGVRVTKGEAKGYFDLGGSTVVLLFRRGAIDLAPDLTAMTAREIETHVRRGEAIGRAATAGGRS
jgi:phosphatidylserine decarboxylase